MATELHRIVVGVDFGTTYSALAWADTSNPNNVEIIKNWPTSGQLVGSQTPSEIAYPDGDTSNYSWGYDISPRARKVKWFKLGLESENDIMQLPSGLTAADVVRDYLTALYQHTMTTLYRRFDRGVMQLTKVDFVLTVPAIWSDAARKKTEDAAIRAGMGNEHGLELLSEPESAAVYTLKSTDNTQSQIKVHDRIVVCDAGGGTVDLISYDIRQTTPSLSVMECAAGTDRNFEALFLRRMGHHHDALSIVNRQQVVKNFETTKVAFRDAPGQESFYVNVPTVGNLEDAGVYGGNFELTCGEMRSLFDPVIDKVIDLIKVQVMTVSAGPQRVNSILLVGGFGESEYLFKRVSAWANQYDIQVIQPRDASTAIVRGAVLKGLEPKVGPAKTEVVRRARRNYGVPTAQLFVTGKHEEREAYVDAHTGLKLARNQISWFIRKNQPMADDEHFTYAFTRHFKSLVPWKDTLVSSTLDVPPTRWDPSPTDTASSPTTTTASKETVHKHCTIQSDLTHLKKEKKKHFKRRWKNWSRYYTANYQLDMGLERGSLAFKLVMGGRTYGVGSVEFDG
ncbi:MAG: hypothetical protein M1827_002542 [Pycnora praestabilis]|nr:MAG: hypothetical protein M1827_002542 [Pycnora praestabilis]